MDALLQPALLNSAHYPFAHLVQQMVFKTIFKKLSTVTTKLHCWGAILKVYRATTSKHICVVMLGQ